jgi:hypothetical protein
MKGKMKNFLCFFSFHKWVYGVYSDMVGTSRHRDCARCGKHEELMPW